MEQERKTRYQPPVERLLTYGESDRIRPDECLITGSWVLGQNMFLS